MPEPRQGFRRLRRRTVSDTVGQPPTRTAVRNAKIVALPVAYAARRAGGPVQRALGKSAREVELDIQARTAQHMFEVLGELKGCAAKFGQILALYELALPPALGEPYREALSKLQDSAPAMLPATVSAAMAASLGPDWRDRFEEFELRASAAASVGQVHRARWHDGRPVAVKLMYPGAREAVHSDLEQVRRLAPIGTVFAPGMDMRAAADAFAECISAELDYTAEAANQRAFHAEYADDPDFFVPELIHQQGDVLISEWVDGIPLTRVIESGAQEERDRVGILVLRFVMSSFARTGLLYTDPHPGNFRVMRDGRIGVVDYGACSAIPREFPAVVGDIGEAALNGTDADLEHALRRHGFVAPERGFDIAALVELIDPIRELFLEPVVHITMRWLRARVLHATQPTLSNVGRQLKSPPEYTPIGRTILSTAGVLCQLGVQGRLRDELTAPLPDLAAAVERYQLGEGPSTVVLLHDRRRQSALRDASSAATPAPTASSTPYISR